MIEEKIPICSTTPGNTLASYWDRMDNLAARIRHKKDYPIVIIGAGLGGLCCGALFSKQGFPVTVIEQHSIPGGYATSFDRAQGKYTFDVSLHLTSANSDTLNLLGALDVSEKIHFVKIPNLTRLITPTQDVRISTLPEQNAEYFSQRFPHERESLKGYFSEIRCVMDEMESLKVNNARKDFPLQYPKLWDLKDKTLLEFVGKYIRDPNLTELLTGRWGSFGLPPSKLAAFYYIIGSASISKGPYYIQPRSQALSSALAQTIEKSGGQIVYKTRIGKILMKNNAVTGVATEQGKHWPAKTVVSNASALATLQDMLPAEALPSDYLREIKRFRPSISSFTIWLGLNKDLHKTIKDCRITISSGRGAEADYLSCLKGEVEKVSAIVTLYDNYYSGYSKPGTSTVTIVTLSGYPPWQQFEADYKAGRKAAYKEEKDRWTNLIMQQVEKKAIPGLSSMVEVAVAATPLTNWRYTGNTDGAIYGFEQSVENSFLGRIKNKTPIKGLYLAGAWGNPGGGYASALKGGQRTFEQVLEDWS
jgi:all-trans-retinol 13,14-reductase